MSSIDDRIVRLEVQDSDFAKRLESDEKALKNLDKTLSSVGSNGIADNLDKIASKFTNLGIVGVRTLENIADKAFNLGTTLVKSLSVDNILTGWEKLSSQTKAVGTLSIQGYDQSEVDDIIKRLMWYSDETSYNFEDMLTSMTKFTAQGYKLKDALVTLQGIANWTAVAGQNAAAGSAAMSTISKAVGRGYVMQNDWSSLQTLMMDNKQVRQMILDTAVELGSLEKTSDTTYRSLSKNVVSSLGQSEFTIEQFATYLTTGKWLTSDVLVATMKKYAQAVEPVYQYVQENNVSAAEAIKALNGQLSDEALNFFAAAQEARSLNDALEATRVGSASTWQKTFNIIFGDYKRQKEIWTDLSGYLYDLFVESGNARNAMLEDWAAKGGSDSLIQGFYNILDAITKVRDTLKTAWTNVFPERTADDLYKLTERFRTFTENLILSDEKADKLKNTLTGLFSIFGNIRNAIKTIATTWKELGGQQELIASFYNILQGAAKILSTIKQAFINIFPPKTVSQLQAVGEGVYNATVRFREFTESLILSDETAEKLGRTFQGVFSLFKLGKDIVYAIIKPIASLFGSSNGLLDSILTITQFFGDLVTNFTMFVERSNVLNIISNIVSGGLKGVFILISSIFLILTKMVEYIITGIVWITDNFSSLTSTISGWFSGAIGSVKNFLDSIFGVEDEIEYTTIEVMPALEGAVNDALDNDAVNEAPKKVSRVKEAFEKLGSTFHSINVNYITPAIDKINKFLGMNILSGGLVQSVLRIIGIISAAKLAWNVAKFFDVVVEGHANIIGLIGNLAGIVRGFMLNLKASAYLKFAEALGLVVLSFWALSHMDTSDIANAIKTAGAISTAISKALSELSIRGAIAMKVLSTINIWPIAIALASVAAILITVVAAGKKFKSFGDVLETVFSKENEKRIVHFLQAITNVFNSSIIGTIPIAIIALANAIKKFKLINISGTLKLFKEDTSWSAQILRFAAAIGLVVASIYALTNLVDAERLKVGLAVVGGIAGVLITLGGILAFLAKKFPTIYSTNGKKTTSTFFNSYAQPLLDIAKAIAIVAVAVVGIGALWGYNQDIVKAGAAIVGGIAAVLGILAALSELIAKKIDSTGLLGGTLTSTMKQIGKTLISVAVAAIIFAFAVRVLPKDDSVLDRILALGLAMAGMAAAIGLISKTFSKDISGWKYVGAAVALVAMSVAMMLVADAILMVSSIPIDSLASSAFWLGAIIVALAGSLALMGTYGAGFWKSLGYVLAVGLMVGELYLIAKVLKQMDEIYDVWEGVSALVAVMGALSAVLALFGAIFAGLPEAFIGMALFGAIIAELALAIELLLPSLDAFSWDISWPDVWSGIGALAGLVAISGGLAAVGAPGALTGLVLAELGWALSVLTPSLEVFSELDWDNVWQGVGAIAAMGAISSVLGPFIPLAALGSLAIAAISWSLGLFADALRSLSSVDLAGIGYEFQSMGEGIGAGIEAIGDGIGGALAGIMAFPALAEVKILQAFQSIGITVGNGSNQMGRYAAAGFSKGLASTESMSLISSAAKMALLGTSLKVLDIHSPSGAYEKQGVESAEGYAIGLESMSGYIEGTVGNIMDDVSDTISSSLGETLSNTANMIFNWMSTITTDIRGSSWGSWLAGKLFGEETEDEAAKRLYLTTNATEEQARAMVKIMHDNDISLRELLSSNKWIYSQMGIVEKSYTTAEKMDRLAASSWGNAAASLWASSAETTKSKKQIMDRFETYLTDGYNQSKLAPVLPKNEIERNPVVSPVFDIEQYLSDLFDFSQYIDDNPITMDIDVGADTEKATSEIDELVRKYHGFWTNEKGEVEWDYTGPMGGVIDENTEWVYEGPREGIYDPDTDTYYAEVKGKLIDLASWSDRWTATYLSEQTKLYDSATAIGKSISEPLVEQNELYTQYSDQILDQLEEMGLKFDNLDSSIGSLGDTFANMGIYLDSGELVGGIRDDMYSALAKLQSYKDKGVYK